MSDQYKRKDSAKLYFALSQGIILFFMIITAVVHHASILNPIRLFAYQFFALFLVGFASFRALRIRTDSLAEIIAISYSAGGVISLLTYMLCMLTLGRSAIIYFVIVEIILSIWYIHSKYQAFSIDSTSSDGMIICLFFLIVYYLLATVSVSFVSSLPSGTEEVAYYWDWPYWVGNNISFTKQFPIQNFRLVGMPFRYHFFSSILMAEAALCTSVDIVYISFHYAYLLGGLLLVFSAYFLATRLLKTKWLVLLTMIAILFTDGRYVTLALHTLYCPFGFDYGYAYSMMAVASLIELVKRDRWREFLIPSVFFLAMTTGCKGPNGMVILIGFGVAAFWLLAKKEYKKGFIGGFIWLGAFLLVFMGFIYSPRTLTADSGLKCVLFHPAAQRLYEQLHGTVLGTMGIDGVLKIIPYIIWFFACNLLTGVLLMIAIIKLLRDAIHREIDVIFLIMSCTAIAGAAVMMFTLQSGRSEMYFMMATFPSAALAGTSVIESEGKKTSCKVRLAVIIPLLLYSSGYCYFGRNTIPRLQEGISRVTHGMDYSTTEYTDGPYCFMDGIDYEAFRWVREHTGIHDIIATDSFKNRNGNNNSLLLGIFSERYVWNEIKYTDDKTESDRRNAVIEKLKTDTMTAVSELADEGVKYLLHQVTDDEMKERKLEDTNWLTELYRNEHYVIYEILAE